MRVCQEERLTRVDSYLDCTSAEKFGLWSCAARRRELSRTKGFWCSCFSCTDGVDETRVLPCPKCNNAKHSTASAEGPTTKQAEAQTEIQTEAGFICFELSDEALAAPWCCEACGSRFADNEEVLFGVAGMNVEETLEVQACAPFAVHDEHRQELMHRSTSLCI